MRSSVLLSLTTLGLSVATLAAPSAQAQVVHSRMIVCRDGTRFDSPDASVCARHRGVDGRATQEARRIENERIARRDERRDDRRDDRRDARDDRRDGRDDRWDDRRDGDRRYGDGYGRRREVYEWNGVVDKEVRIQLRGSRAYVQGVNAADDRNSRGRMINSLPLQTGNLVVQRLAGRGDVLVIEQPTSRNNYTATLRIRDPRGGTDRYRIVAYWEPPVTYGYGR
ncbi:MAG TPA: hypothetical protein VJT85_09265 [Gemmatimonadaceae bacterium]|nr:hypothetical protein [Gemmatimonadaceae bacterium]